MKKLITSWTGKCYSHSLMLLTLSIIVTGFSLFVPSIHAADNSYTATPAEAIGQVQKPPGTDVYVSKTNPNENQLMPFISTLLTIATVIAGIWVLFNIFIAAYTAIMSSGDAQSMDKVKTAITNSVIGLLLIVLAYTFAALAGTIFFGDATLFIQPRF